MNNTSLDEEILAAIKNGSCTREKLMAIESLRHRTWAVIGERLATLTNRGALISSKAGWRLA